MKTTAKRGYVVRGAELQRAIVLSDGRLTTDGQTWTRAEVVTEGPAYERWVDAPASWLGVLPYWGQR